MDAGSAAATAAVATSLARIVTTLGPGGTLAAIVLVPVLFPAVSAVLGFFRGRRQMAELAAYREEMAGMVEAQRVRDAEHWEEMDGILERYKDDTRRILDSYGKSQAQISQYYRDNVELVKQWERIANGFQDLVAVNTKALERLCAQIEHNRFCPMARAEKGGGS